MTRPEVHMSGDERRDLRPVERAVLRHLDRGAPGSEIAWRFRRTPGFILRVRELSEIPRRPKADGPAGGGGLRPIERCVLNARQAGTDYAEIAARLRRSPSFVARVEQLATVNLRGRVHDEGMDRSGSLHG